jgi:hypothetical protein
MAANGWADFRYTSIRNLDLDSDAIEGKLGFATFSSRTVRAFKLDGIEDICEDYGQVAYYDGSIPEHPHFFDLDDHHRFFKDKPMLVCGNTASMLSDTRYSKAFKILGDRSIHFGAFEGCGDYGMGASGCDCNTVSGGCC